MNLVEIKNKEELNKFVSAEEHSAFLESYEWGEFQASAGNKVLRFGVEDKGEFMAAATLIEKRLPLGMKYWYSPRGPIFRITHNVEHITFFFNEINKKAKKEKIIFLRFEPTFDVTRYALRVTRTIDIQPSKTLLLDLSKSEEELLKDMHEKTRYNIRLAEKKGIEIITSPQDLPLSPSFVRREDKAQGEGSADFDEWWKIMEQTKTRDKFRLHEKEYYQKQLSITNYQPCLPAGRLRITNSELNVKLFLAKYQGKIISGNIVAFFGDTVTYMHGASSNEFRNLMAPYALQWHCIKLAKELGYKYYDFYGISETKWPGVTRFKKGFAGFEYDYPGTFDAVFSRGWYGIYGLLRKIRRAV
ncbi:MAG: peptidoglycan bridge formation glycyltransferase FemA/FemB family protein [Patescibacteria group bacterium]|nr:peptidoglycan bridge formation glycyltransferase FemA/FemB family protein [Patescibacteria group bacterium]MDD4610806.1 peptidoglycan bridge formation glycyltransferase FemA/FemB family protein [Patescibacteria group bacterium]